MTAKRHIEIFSAGCQICEDTIALVKRLACPSCQVTVMDMNDRAVASRARVLGLCTFPAVVINGQIASCCAGQGASEEELRQAGVGQPLT